MKVSTNNKQPGTAPERSVISTVSRQLVLSKFTYGVAGEDGAPSRETLKDCRDFMIQNSVSILPRLSRLCTASLLPVLSLQSCSVR